MGTINNGVLDGTRRVEPGVRGLGVNGGIAGAPLGMRLRGATLAGAPAIGSWKAGDQVSDRNGAIWICTVSGTPGTWAGAGGGGFSNPMSAAGDLIAGGSSGAPARVAGSTAATRKFLRELGTGSAANAPVWDTLLMADIPGAIVPVPVPTGLTATDTPAVQAAITALTAALTAGPATLLFADGVYQVDSNSLVVRSPNTTTVGSASNAAVPGTWTTSSPGTLTVASASGFPAAGRLFLACGGNTQALVSYTGTTGTTFTGCVWQSGTATGTLSTGGAVTGAMGNFAVRSSGRAVIQQAPNRTALPNNTSGDLFVIADCLDFRVEDVIFDCNRDAVAPLTPLSASASSGQPSVTVAAGSGANYVVGQNLSVYGGLGSSDQAKSDGVAGTQYAVQSITPGGGTGGGDLITFGNNLSNSYTQVSATAVGDGFGPYAYAGAYLSPYEPDGISNSVAGRTGLKGEDQQNPLHLLNCQRFAISRVTAKNSWSSQIKCGTGFNPTALTDGCSGGLISGCTVYHGYDQGVSLWNSSDITVTGCTSNASGWGGIVTFSANDCSITGNVVVNPVYAVPVSLANGNGIAIQGGSRNAVSGNVIDSPMQNGVYLLNQGPAVTGAPPTGVTTTAYLPAQTTAGTSVAVSATTVSSVTFAVGSQLSILDGYRTEIVYIASVVDSTHLTFSNATRFAHPSGCSLSYSVAEDTIVSGNSIWNTYADGIGNSGVRTLIQGNTIVGSAIRSGIAAPGIANSSGGYGSVITGNQVGGGFGTGIQLWSVDHMIVTGNEVSGPLAGTAPGMDIQLIADSVISGNRVSDVLSNAGMEFHGTTPVAARCTISGNLVTRCMGDGIGLEAAAVGCTINGNTVSSCYGTAGINLNGVTYSTISGNVCTGNHNSGIQLNDNGSNHCLYNTFTGNVCRDDGSGVRIDTGAAVVQQYGIRELGNSDYNNYYGNECDTNSSAQLVLLGTHSRQRDNIISNALIPPTVTTPGMPATTVAQQNATGHDVVAYITATTVTVITVGATVTGMTSGMIYVPAGQTITLTYATGTPTWVWLAVG